MDFSEEEQMYTQLGTTVMSDVNQTPTEYFDYGDMSELCAYNNSIWMQTVVSPIINSIICILGFVGNSLVIVTYAFYKRTKSMTDIYLLNVAISDLLFVLALPLIIYNEMSSWSMGPVACKLLRGSYSINLYSGMLLLACISTDRYIAIVQARRNFRLRSLSYSRIICAIVWVFAILVSVPTFYFYQWYEPAHEYDYHMVDGEYFETDEPQQYVCELVFTDSIMARTTKVAIPITQLAVGFFLPLSIMIFCYTAVIVTLMKAKNFQRHKAVRVVLAVVVVFITCHLPYNLVLLYDTFFMFKEAECEDLDRMQTVQMVLQSIAYLHCCLNPVLYAFVGVKFRNHLKMFFQDLCCLGKKYIAPRRSSRVTSEFDGSAACNSMDGSSENGSSFTM